MTHKFSRLNFKMSLLVIVVNFGSLAAVQGQGTSYCGLAVPDQQSRVRTGLTGTENTILSSSSHFKVHYTLSGTDASSLAYAQEVANIAEVGWTFYSNLGWTLPPPDGGSSTIGITNPDALYDIVIGDLGLRRGYPNGVSGATFYESAYNTLYANGYTSWIEIHKVMPTGLPVPADDILQTTVVHELHHACQYAYSGDFHLHNDLWFMENTSEYMQHLILLPLRVRQSLG